MIRCTSIISRRLSIHHRGLAVSVSHLSKGFPSHIVGNDALLRRCWFSEKAEEDAAAIETPQNVSDFRRFQDLVDLDPAIKKSVAHLDLMSPIQNQTFDVVVSGEDVIARSQTGTGKTIAYLLPSIQRLVKARLEEPRDGKSRQVQMLVVAPTRELAQQIYKEAKSLTQGLDLTAQVIYGGVPRSRDDAILRSSNMPDILIATPGRLCLHLKSTKVDERPFQEYLKRMRILVLDEMDQLLDMGFRDEINQIVSNLPKDRQSLLFSATIPKSERTFKKYVKNNSIFVDCVDEKDPVTLTNEAVNQSYVILPVDRMVWGVLQIVLELMSQPETKVLVFFPMTSQVVYFASLFNRGLGRPVLEMHAKMSQTARTITSFRFRHAKKAVMISSDVSARGVDYPNVTHVIQIGLPNNRESYIHRIGRTGRGGKKGESLLMLLDCEKGFISQELSELQINLDHRLSQQLNRSLPFNIESDLMRVFNEMRFGRQEELKADAEAVYRALFGYICSKMNVFDFKSDTDTAPFVDIVNAFANQAGLATLPPICGKIATQLGVFDDPRVAVESTWSPENKFDMLDTEQQKRFGKTWGSYLNPTGRLISSTR